jgi:hypothetical protein
VHEKKPMDQSNLIISIPSSNYYFQYQRGLITSTSFTERTKSSAEYVKGRDDFAFVQHIQKERRTLFPETTTLAFDIEHYCMMVEMVRTNRHVRLKSQSPMHQIISPHHSIAVICFIPQSIQTEFSKLFFFIRYYIFDESV